MPYYKPLRNLSATVRKRTVRNLKDLREQLEAELPTKTTSESLILGTWNIRNFDDNRFNHGPRLEESFYYIAEIIARFDVIAVQEICRDLGPLNKLMGVLGGQYDYILTDVTAAGLGGNDERLGFIYDRDKVNFKGIAGEIVLPPKMLIGGKEENQKRQFSRTPFSCSFQSGWFKFMFATVHIYFGSPTGPNYERRVEEIEKVAEYLSDEAERSDDNYILVGDFNIVKPGSRGFNALEKNGFQVIQNKEGSNAQQTKFYDQISFKARQNELQIIEPERDDRVFQFFNSVYSPGKFRSYRSTIRKLIEGKIDEVESELRSTTAANKRRTLEKRIERLKELIASDEAMEEYYIREWRTFQMSDHLPLWVELKVDYSEEYLDSLT